MAKIILNKKINTILFAFLLSVIFFAFSYNIGMFWDNVLFTSKMGGHLFENNPFNWKLPYEIDPGHPPFLGFLLSIFWNIFGKTLWVSHLLMIPFSFGFFYQLLKFIKFYNKSNLYSFLAFFLIIADPTLSTQLLIVNPEIIQLFFFFLVVNSILYKNDYLKIIGLFFLSIISYRSMMLFFGVFLFDLLNNIIINKQKIKNFLNIKFIFIYAIGAIPAFVYLLWRYNYVGWILTNPNSPWAENHEIISFTGFLRNLIVLAHRFLDFGRIFIFIFLIASIFILKKSILKKENIQLILLAISSILVVTLVSVIMTNPFGHRYFLIFYIIITFIAFQVVTNLFQRKKLLYSLLFIGLITGNLWIYPRNIAQGWDASLAHLPYYNLRKEAIKYLDKEKIEIDSTASFFPNATKINNIDFNADFRSFKNFSGDNSYVFFSNVYNLSDEEYNQLDTKYTIIKQFKKNNIYINIYKLKE